MRWRSEQGREARARLRQRAVMRNGELGYEWWHAVGSHSGGGAEKGGVVRRVRQAPRQYGLLTSFFLS